MTSQYSLGPKNEEVFSPEFMTHLLALNKLIAAEGETIEGNLFYFHQTPDFVNLPPDPKRIHKRRNVHAIVKHKRDFLEVGFNAGHSALLALSSNPKLKYFGLDIGIHRYTAKCAEYLKAQFPGRIEFMIADSREGMPKLIEEGRKFSCIHVDGGHSAEVCRMDLKHSIKLAAKGAHLILDDTRSMRITDVYNEFVASGFFVTENLCGMWEKRDNILARFM